MQTMEFTVDAREVIRLFRDLPDALVRRHMRRVMEKAGRPLSQAIRREVRAIKTADSTGTLGRSIGVVAKTGKVRPVTTVRIGALRKPAVLAPLTRHKRTQRKRDSVSIRERKATRYFHLAGKGRDGKERVGRLFASHQQQMATDIALGLEQALIQEVTRLRARQ